MSVIQNIICYSDILWYNKSTSRKKSRGGRTIGVTPIPEEYELLTPLFKLRIAEYEVREGRKFDRKEASRKTGLSLSHLSGVFNGKQYTSTENLFVLANMLECKVDELYKYEED
jgi:DNA-binding Xre family transcriptional regulator